MMLVYNCSAFVDKQMLKVQEAPNDIPEGETPHTVTMFTRQDLVDAVKPGDRVKVVGIYRAQPVRVNPRGREVKSIYKTFIDVMHVEKDGSHDDLFSMMMDEVGADGAVSNTSNMTAEEVQAKKQKFHEISSTPNVYERLAASLAPSIWQLDDVKKGAAVPTVWRRFESSAVRKDARGDQRAVGRGSWRFQVTDSQLRPQTGPEGHLYVRARAPRRSD